ncbi:MAG: DUF3341 domain-containing protein [Methylotenera sp.]|nr:DUF3341 domain-containing protein [Oligoflexia bacterium]
MTITPQRELAGVVGFFESPEVLIHGMEKVRDAKYQCFDAFTPFPVHGLEHAQGLKRSPLPFVTLFAGLTGFACAFGLQYWTSVVDWPINVAGKPLNSWPAFVPILFELTVLFAGLATVGAMFALNGLPNMKKKSFDPGITRDRFAIMIDAPRVYEINEEEMDENEIAKIKAKTARFKPFDENEAKEFLKKAGATEVRSVYSEGWF